MRTRALLAAPTIALAVAATPPAAAGGERAVGWRGRQFIDKDFNGPQMVSAGPDGSGLGSAVAAVDAAYAAALGAIPDGRAKRQGVALGQAAHAAILALRAADGSDTPLFDTAYPRGTQPGEYRFTPCRQPFLAARALSNGS
jgi:hypothetical protein